MLVFDYNQDFLIGPAQLSIGGYELGPTLEGTDPMLSFTPILEEVKTDEDSDVKAEKQLGEKVLFKGVLPFTSDTATLLDLTRETLTLHRIDTFKIESKNLTVDFYNASIKMTVKKAYTATAVNTIELEVKALPGSSGKKYNLNITS